MSRLTQALAYINADPKELNNEWIEFNLTSISINSDLKQIRKTRIKNDRKTKETTRP
jgi:hypothetical protein